MQEQVIDVRREIRRLLEERFGEQVQVEFVYDDHRLDVRVSNVGVIEELEQLREDLKVSSYSELRFTVRME